MTQWCKNVCRSLIFIPVLLVLLLPGAYANAQVQKGGGNIGGGAGGGNIGGGGGAGPIESPLSVDNIEELLVRIANWLLGIVAVLSLIGIIMSGIRMVIAIGNEQAIAHAKKILFWSVAGLVISALALTIINILGGILGFAQSTPLTPTVYAADVGLDVANQVNLDVFDETEIASRIVQLITSLAVIIALAVFIFGAIMMIVSLGDDNRVATAKKIMLYAVIGLILIGMAYVIILVVHGLIFGNGN